jgi:hypothetical protein
VRASLQFLVAVALSAATGPFACVDEEHNEEVQKLGPEQPGVPKGPDHRPGQPCVTCHGGSGPASLQFSIGGTVYDVQGGSTPSVGAKVLVEDVDGHLCTATTNTVGNFYVTLDQCAPHYPTQPTVAPADGAIPISMVTHVSRDGSCADCHYNPIGPASAGPVYAHRTTTQ